MRSILLHANRDPGFESRLQTALDLARQFDGHLTCLQPVSFDFGVPGDFYGSALAEMVPVIRELAARFRSQVEARLVNEDVRWEWIDEAGIADSCMLEYASLSDLVIAGANAEAARRGPSPLVGRLALHSRTPLLVVPHGHPGFSLDTAALVAWNGSQEAARALRAALPFLKRAKKVWLASVDEDSADSGYDLPSLRGAEYLARHDVDCELVSLPEKGGIPATLENAAQSRGAGYIVMGAYGHSRAMEALFGGVTRTLLSKPMVPVILAH